MEGGKRSFEPRKGLKITKNTALWTLAVLLTLLSVIYQRVTGPTQPINGVAEIGGTKIKYRLVRSHAGEGDATMEFKAPPSVGGSLYFKRYKTGQPFMEDRMEYHSERLFARLPHQPPAGKLEYYAVFRSGGMEVRIPEGRTAVIRFRGAVPFFPMAVHIMLMFAAMLVSMRALFEAISPSGMLKNLAYWSLWTYFAGGLIFGPIVQKYSFGAYWTGVPLGWDLTDNKTLIAFLAWAGACWVISFWKAANEKRKRLAVIAAAVVTVAIFLIPHSMMGSELDYSKLDKGIPPSQAVTQGM